MHPGKRLHRRRGISGIEDVPVKWQLLSCVQLTFERAERPLDSTFTARARDKCSAWNPGFTAQKKIADFARSGPQTAPEGAAASPDANRFAKTAPAYAASARRGARIRRDAARRIEPQRRLRTSALPATTTVIIFGTRTSRRLARGPFAGTDRVSLLIECEPAPSLSGPERPGGARQCVALAGPRRAFEALDQSAAVRVRARVATTGAGRMLPSPKGSCRSTPGRAVLV
jgi:hypothetical protein